MSWSLKVRNGDLVIGAGRFDTVTRDAKLVQDFRHFLLEGLGHDPDYPWYGSSLEDEIGEYDWRFAKVRLESEIRRIGSLYQRMQMERAKNDQQRYNKSTLTAGEVLAAIDDVLFYQSADVLRITVVLRTARDTTVAIDATLPAVVTT